MAVVKSMLKSDVEQEYQKYLKGWRKVVHRIQGLSFFRNSSDPKMIQYVQHKPCDVFVCVKSIHKGLRLFIPVFIVKYHFQPNHLGGFLRCLNYYTFSISKIEQAEKKKHENTQRTIRNTIIQRNTMKMYCNANNTIEMYCNTSR